MKHEPEDTCYVKFRQLQEVWIELSLRIAYAARIDVLCGWLSQILRRWS